MMKPRLVGAKHPERKKSVLSRDQVEKSQVSFPGQKSNLIT